MTTATCSTIRHAGVRGAFDLTQSASRGFGQREAAPDAAGMRLGFLLDGSFRAAGVAVRQPRPDELELTVSGTTQCDVAAAQALRVLSADVDARGWDALGSADPVLGRLQAARPGLRPPLFHSAYEALLWCVLSARRPHAQGVALRERLNRAHGTVLEIDGMEVPVSPAPEQMLAVASLPSVPEWKLRRMHGVARAAADGRLDTAELRALDPAEASARLRELPGIGPYYAELVVVRALGHTDVLAARRARRAGRRGCPAHRQRAAQRGAAAAAHRRMEPVADVGVCGDARRGPPAARPGRGAVTGGSGHPADRGVEIGADAVIA